MTRDAIPWTPEGAPASYNPYAQHNHQQVNIPFGGTAHLIPNGGAPRVPPPHLCRDPRAQQQQMAQYHALQQQQQQAPQQPPHPMPGGMPMGMHGGMHGGMQGAMHG
eukprot:CAMPEP_0173090286 /NCGR_PEP_ID=MMETSP1102-20130122/26766_1 /TAXON_ID=49646 /ORGANISM="Geminigera sp., Strain Caron Lab Isolate" /LENGTH=106 /DNA_ID=CAMNT_0013975005 /DNA_START=108 /DNA_END=425 /DNA_ORIENTATION=-